MSKNNVQGVEEYGDDETTEVTEATGSRTRGGRLPSVKSPTAVDPRIIVVDKSENVSRWDAQEQDRSYVLWLAHDMSLKGNVEPVKVRRVGPSFKLVAGFNRHEASMLIIEGFEYIPAGEEEPIRIHNPDFRLKVLLVTGNDEDMILQNIRENAVKRPLTPMDHASIVRYMEDIMGKSVNEIAEALGCNPSYVSQFRKLLALPREIQQKVHRNEMAARAAMLLADMTKEDQEKILREAEEEKEKGGKGKVTLSRVAAVGRDRIAKTGQGRRVSRTAGDIRKFFDGMTGPAESKAIRVYADFMVEWIRGHKTDKQHEQALYELLRSEDENLDREDDAELEEAEFDAELEEAEA